MYKMFMGLKMKELWDLTLESQFNPSERVTKRLAEIYEEIEKETTERHNTRAEQFILEYGNVLYRFIERLENKKNFLAYKDNFYFRWIAEDNADNEEYNLVRFRKEQFDYVNESYSGYGPIEVLEEDIKKSRVLELLKK